MEGIFLIESILILIILGYQLYVYKGNKLKIRAIEELYPSEHQLALKESVFTPGEGAGAVSGISVNQQWEELLAGKPFKEYSLLNPVLIRAIKVEKDEVRIDARNGEAVQQYNVAKDRLRKLLEDGKILFPDATGQQPPTPTEAAGLNQEPVAFDLLEVSNPSPTFSKIIRSTNEYLKRNKGAAADFEILKDVSERHSESLDAEVQATIATPLYVGLLGTFSGVIIGLSSLVWSGLRAPEAAEGVETLSPFITDQNIPSFLFGVLIAMAGSFLGLLLTLMGNQALKNARSKRDMQKNTYYTFLQTNLLPKLNSDMAASLGNLKSVLDSFNKDFLDKILGFRPIVDSLTENISVQKEFIQKLDEIGFTQMANANMMVFDKIKESEKLFMNFMKYQEALNQSVEKGAALTNNIEQVLSRLTSLQDGFDQVPGYLQKHDESIQRQINFFGRHEQELTDIASRTEQYFDKAALKLTDLMEARLQHQERDAQNAYAKWQEHFRLLNEDNVYQRIVDYMRPFENLNQQQNNLNTQQRQLSDNIGVTNERLLQKLETDSQVQQQMLQQLRELNAFLVKSAEPGPVKAAFQKIFGGNSSSNRRVG
ncbi:hypothetical protein FVR03_05135 [Pontibacter qinzhouensis]|uniref:MotA/TolQ/ExbB proton channel domain-containing protein n=1 Tax=Pontibacter qinzhouensis TaxID=2603253 RepID=A0A5C8K8V0_9BACT|nr:hypothetical protein [Pontibacter qinzhouensis]TXK50277.1 hypothetical protein FVR03_05135 [Pontibacter qinzhouensis]